MADAWTVEDVPDCSETTAVVTGANSGLGFEATKVLANKGATVVMACRSIERGEAAAAEIESAVDAGTAALDVRECDLASLDSVAAFAVGLKRDYDAIEVLCNNAGVMAIPRQETAEGFEKQLGVNHLGHFALTGHLLELVRAGDGRSRVVTHSSGAHTMGAIDFEDLHRETSYGRWEAYGQSKLANLLFAYELQRRLEAAGIADTISLACHPGYAATNLQFRGPEQTGSRGRLWLMKVANTLFGQSARRGALPMLYAATAPDVEGGEYYGPGGLLNMRGTPERQSSSVDSYDPETAERLWERSETLCGSRFGLG